MKKYLLLALLLMIAGVGAQAQATFALEQKNGFELLLQDNQFGFNAVDGTQQVLGTGIGVGDIKRISRASQDGMQLAIKNVTNHSVDASILNKSGQPYYYAQVVEIDTLTTYDTPEKLYQQCDYKRWQAWAWLYEMEVKDYVTYFGMVQKDDIINTHVSSLKPNKQYCLYAYGVDSDVEMATPVRYMTFTTGPVIPVDVSFDLQATVRGKNVDVTVTPSDAEIPYYFDVVEVSTINKFGKSTLEDNIAAYINDFVGFVGQGSEVFYKNMGRKGAQQRTYDYLEVNTDYYFFAVAVDAGMNMVSPVALKEITTQDISSSDNVLTVNIMAGYDNAYIEVTPSNSDRYICMVLNADEVEGKSDEELITYLETQKAQSPYYLDFMYGQNEPWLAIASRFLTVVPGNTYYAVVFGYETKSQGYETEGVVTTEIQRIAFTLHDSPLTSAEQAFYFRSESYDGDGAAVAVLPLQTGLPYYTGMAKGSMSDEEILQMIAGKAAAAGKTPEEFMLEKAQTNASQLMLLLPDGPSMMSLTGGEEMPAELLEMYGIYTIEPDTDYRVFAVGLNEDGSMAQDLQFEKVINIKAEYTTPVSAPKKTLKERLPQIRR